MFEIVLPAYVVLFFKGFKLLHVFLQLFQIHVIIVNMDYNKTFNKTKESVSICIII